MRRNSTHKTSVVSIRWIIFLVLYQVASALYVFISPLIGFMFCYLSFLTSDEQRTHEEDEVKKYLAYSYMVFINLNKGFYLFSGVITFLLFYYLLHEWINNSIKCKNCIIFAFVSIGYVGIFGMNNLLAYVLNNEFFHFGYEYFLYILFDFVVAVVYYRDRLI